MENILATIQQKKLLFGGIAALVVLLIIGGVYLLTQRPGSSTPTRPLPKEVKVNVTEDGFTPEKVTIGVDSAVRWVNETDGAVTVNSDDHPTHQNDKELNLGEFAPDSSVVLIFTEKGSFTYHDHLHPKNTGTVVVE